MGKKIYKFDYSDNEFKIIEQLINARILVEFRDLNKLRKLNNTNESLTDVPPVHKNLMMYVYEDKRHLLVKYMSETQKVNEKKVYTIKDIDRFNSAVTQLRTVEGVLIPDFLVIDNSGINLGLVFSKRGMLITDYYYNNVRFIIEPGKVKSAIDALKLMKESIRHLEIIGPHPKDVMLGKYPDFLPPMMPPSMMMGCPFRS